MKQIEVIRKEQEHYNKGKRLFNSKCSGKSKCDNEVTVVFCSRYILGDSALFPEGTLCKSTIHHVIPIHAQFEEKQAPTSLEIKSRAKKKGGPTDRQTDRQIPRQINVPPPPGCEHPRRPSSSRPRPGPVVSPPPPPPRAPAPPRHASLPALGP